MVKLKDETVEVREGGDRGGEEKRRGGKRGNGRGRNEGDRLRWRGRLDSLMWISSSAKRGGGRDGGKVEEGVEKVGGKKRGG